MKMIVENLTEENFSDDPSLPVGIITTFEKIRHTRMVSTTDVKPFIDYFPMNVGLDNFTDLPSEKGLDIALEGFAVLFKVTAGVLLVSALGVCIFNFIRSRKAAEATADAATSGVLLSKEINNLMNQIRLAPGYLNRHQPLIQAKDIPLGPTGHGRSFTMLGEVSFKDWSDRFYEDGRDQHFVNAIASKVASGEFFSVTEHLMTPMADYMSDLGNRVKQLTAMVNKMGEMLNSGRLDQMVKDIEGLDTRSIRGVFLGILERVYGKELGQPRANLASNSAELMNDRVQSLKDYYDSTKDDKNFVQTHYQQNADRWRSGNVEGMLGDIPRICDHAAKLGAAPSLSTGKNIVDECEKLRRLLAPMEVPEMVDQALKNTLESIRLDSIASVNLFEMIINEQRQFTIYVQDILGLTIELAGAVAVFSRPNDPSGARKLTQDAVNATKAMRKVKL